MDTIILTSMQRKITKVLFEDAFNLKTYTLIMGYSQITDVSQNREFQKIFIEYFKIKRSEAWRKTYFDYFEAHKNNKEITLAQILRYLYKKTGNIEPLLASHMLSTINDNRPAWDISLLIPRLPAADPYWEKVYKLKGKPKITEIENLYNKITDLQKKFLNSNIGKECVGLFDTLVSQYAYISDYKKIELMNWKELENTMNKFSQHSVRL